MTGHLADVWFRSTDLKVVSGAGCIVTTDTGDEYLDFTSGIAVTSTGHCHPKVVKAIQDQAARFIHAQVNCYVHDRLHELADAMARHTPASIERFFFCNSGAEAVEAAVKLAKQVTKRPNVIVVEGSFHGRTHMTMAMTTSKASYRAGHQPLPAGVHVTPFPYHFRTGETPGEASERCLRALDHLLHSQTAPSETAAIVIEPVLGEGGYVPAPAEYMAGLRRLCDEHGILLVADEVQSGAGRTGTLWAVDQLGIDPDVIVFAKGFASGFPIAGIGARAELIERWPQGSHGGTYGGNPMGCAAALATLDVLTGPGFLDNVVARGEQLRQGLRRLAERHPSIADVRGPGLMVASELVATDGSLDSGRCSEIVAHCRTEGRLLLMTAGTDANVVRWMPPLVVSEAELGTALDVFGAALDATA